MKKIIKKISVFWVCFISIVCTSCIDVGLGSAIDLTPPTVSISSHKDNEVVPNAFTLSGSAFDNRELASITISCESHNLYYRVYPGENWYKKNTSTQDEWVLVENSEGSGFKTRWPPRQQTREEGTLLPFHGSICGCPDEGAFPWGPCAVQVWCFGTE